MQQESGKLDSRMTTFKRQTLQLGTMIRSEERKMQAMTDQRDGPDRHTDQIAYQLVEEKAKLNNLRKSQISAVSRATPVVRVQSYPTPISETVLGNEEHFRLREGRVVRIPFQELQNELLNEKRQLLWELKDQPEVVGSVGPIDGFKLEYRFVRTYNSVTWVKGFYVPATTNYDQAAAKIGEPLAQALAPNSSFRQDLLRLDRANTTITVWTYADSFREFRLLKKELYSLGFTVAARPLRQNGQIGVSPRGTRSTTQ